jgi:hypothetical protein
MGMPTMCLGAIVERRPGSPDVAAVRSLSRISSQYVIATSRIVFALAATICVASMSHAQSGQPMRTAVILPDVALLLQGPFGEYSYKLTSTADDSVTLEEFGGQHLRLEIRQIPDKRCVCLYQGGKGWGRRSATGSYEIRRDLSALGSLPRAGRRSSRKSLHLLSSFRFAEAGVLFFAVSKTGL